MAQWFWIVVVYSFFGYCLEKGFARAVNAPHQTRKCFLLLPLCPVYGLAMAAVAALTEPGMGFLPLAAVGGAVCTGVEYLVHLFYDRTVHTWFWDSRDMGGNVAGRICPQFALIWGILSALAVRWVQPWVERAAAVVPPEVTYGLWLVLAADGVLTWALLRRYRDPEALNWARFRQLRASSQSSTS